MVLTLAAGSLGAMALGQSPAQEIEMLSTDPTSTEAVANPKFPSPLITKMPPSPTLTHTPTFMTANSPKEVIDRSPTFVKLTVVLALFASVIVTVRDWKRLR